MESTDILVDTGVTDNSGPPAVENTYILVDTGVTEYYSDTALISEPSSTDAFFGQDAHYSTNSSSYTDNGDGTITDNITGLMWQKDIGDKNIF